MHPAVLTLLLCTLFVAAFGGLAAMRRQGFSRRFLLEGLASTLACGAAAYLLPWVNPVVWLLLVYLAVMRVRLMVDVGNWFTGRAQYARALALLRLAPRLGADAVGRRLARINEGVALLKMGQAEEAFSTLQEALAGTVVQLGAKHLAAGYYNLGLACKRTGRDAQAQACFRDAIHALPTSIYALAARKAME